MGILRVILGYLRIPETACNQIIQTERILCEKKLNVGIDGNDDEHDNKIILKRKDVKILKNVKHKN